MSKATQKGNINLFLIVQILCFMMGIRAFGGEGDDLYTSTSHTQGTTASDPRIPSAPPWDPRIHGSGVVVPMDPHAPSAPPWDPNIHGPIASAPPAPESMLAALEDQVAQLEHETYSPELQFSTPRNPIKYDKIVFLDFMGDDMDPGFDDGYTYYRDKRTVGNVERISINSHDDLSNPSLELKEKLRKLEITAQSKIKIVIRGHGEPGSNIITSDKSHISYTSSEIAEFVQNHFPPRQMNVSVISCSSGLGLCENPDNASERSQSFSENFLKDLKRHGIEADVKATNGPSPLHPEGVRVWNAQYGYDSHEWEKTIATLKEHSTLLIEHEELREDLNILNQKVARLNSDGKEIHSTLETEIAEKQTALERLSSQMKDISFHIDSHVRRAKTDPTARVTYTSANTQPGQIGQHPTTQMEEIKGSVLKMQAKIDAELENLEVEEKTIRDDVVRFQSAADFARRNPDKYKESTRILIENHASKEQKALTENKRKQEELRSKRVKLNENYRVLQTDRSAEQGSTEEIQQKGNVGKPSAEPNEEENQLKQKINNLKLALTDKIALKNDLRDRATFHDERARYNQLLTEASKDVENLQREQRELHGKLANLREAHAALALGKQPPTAIESQTQNRDHLVEQLKENRKKSAELSKKSSELTGRFAQGNLSRQEQKANSKELRNTLLQKDDLDGENAGIKEDIASLSEEIRQERANLRSAQQPIQEEDLSTDLLQTPTDRVSLDPPSLTLAPLTPDRPLPRSLTDPLAQAIPGESTAYLNPHVPTNSTDFAESQRPNQGQPPQNVSLEISPVNSNQHLIGNRAPANTGLDTPTVGAASSSIENPNDSHVPPNEVEVGDLTPAAITPGTELRKASSGSTVAIDDQYTRAEKARLEAKRAQAIRSVDPTRLATDRSTDSAPRLPPKDSFEMEGMRW